MVEEANGTAITIDDRHYVNDIYFNVYLSEEEILDYIKNANLTWKELDDRKIVRLLDDDYSREVNLGLISMEGSEFITLTMPTTADDQSGIAYVSPMLATLVPELPFLGWNPNLVVSNGFFEYDDYTLWGKEEAENLKELKQLISATPFKQSKAPVPNSGYVDTIKLNTSLSPEEVDKIITEANLTFDEFQGMPSYFVYVSFDSTYSQSDEGMALIISNPSSLMDLPQPGYVIIEYITGAMLYISEIYNGMEHFTGWNNDFFTNVVNGDCLKTNGTAESIGPEGFYFEGIKFGTQNDKLVDLICIDSEPFSKELKGTYEPVTVEVTENSSVDLTTYWDNGEMPVKINVNVESSGDSGVPLQPATEEEMNNLLVNENIGKIFLYTGETNENFTNGEYYIIEEVTE